MSDKNNGGEKGSVEPSGPERKSNGANGTDRPPKRERFTGLPRVDTTEVEKKINLDLEVGPTHRSKWGNGKEILPGVDARTSAARKIRDIYQDIMSDLGGDENVSAIQRGLAIQIATLVAMGFDFAAQYAEKDKKYDYINHLLCIRTLSSTSRLLGTKRLARLINPPDKKKLPAYLAGE